MIDEIRNILQEHRIIHSEENGWIWVKPQSEDGFEVGCAEDERLAYVSCSGWHEEFEDKEDARNCFLNALTPRIRILISTRGSYEHKWEYQAFENNSWQSYGVTGLLVFPFWRKAKKITKINSVLK